MSSESGMTIPFQETGAAPLRQPDLAVLREDYRVQGEPMVRLVPRETRGGGFGNIDDHPLAWGVWVMADGQWRRIVSARGNAREWTSLDRVADWLQGLGFSSFSVDSTRTDAS